MTSVKAGLEEVGAHATSDWDELYRAYQSGEIAYPWVAGPKSAVAGERGRGKSDTSLEEVGLCMTSRRS